MELFAYIDAGTGSVIAQAVIGFVVGAGVIIRAYWSKIRAFLGKNKKQDSDFRSKEPSKDA